MKFLPTFITLVLLARAAASDLGNPDSDIDKEIQAATLVRAGMQAPDFTCTTTDGRKLTLSALKGKVAVLYFYASSLPACFTQMKYLEKIVHEKLRERDDLVILGIGRGHTREEVVVHGGKNALTYHLAPDPDQSIYKKYFTAFVPRILVVDRGGRIVHLQSGSREYEGVLSLMLVLQAELKKPAGL